jgi:hypothetical protein
MLIGETIQAMTELQRMVIQKIEHSTTLRHHIAEQIQKCGLTLAATSI